MSFKTIVTNTILPIIDDGIKLLLTLSVIAFIIGVIRVVYHSGEESSHSEGRQMMVWGILALAVMVSVWGLVAIMKTTIFG